MPNEDELNKHACFEGKTIYLNEGIIYCSSDDNFSNDKTNEETFNEFHHSNNIISNVPNDTINEEREPDIPQLKYITPKNLNKNGKLFLIYF